MSFTKDNTLELKGIMVLLLVFHHCFYAVNTLGPTFMLGGLQYNVIQSIAMAARICVMAFIVMSGYGIYKKIGGDAYKLYTNSFVKLYINYIFVVIVTLVLSFFFRNDFPEIYGEPSSLKILYRIITSMTGFQFLFASGGINMTWWFASFLIICYCIYPILLKVVEKHPCLVLCVSLLFVPLRDVNLFHIGIFGILSYLSSFILGIILAKYEILERISFCCKRMSVYIVLSIVCILAKILLYRWEMLTYYIDLCLIVLLMLILMSKKHKLNIFNYFGKISMDIYYLHYLFIFYIAIFSQFIYSQGNFIIIYIKALGISVVAHYIVDGLRRILKINRLIECIEAHLGNKIKGKKKNETVRFRSCNSELQDMGRNS